MKPITLLMPTFNNPRFLYEAVSSILRYAYFCPVRLVVVNNGARESIEPSIRKRAEVIDTGKNLGWEGGLVRGLQETDSEIVGFVNDDIFVPRSSALWLRELGAFFRDPRIGMIGPSSNCVMGMQNVFVGDFRPSLYVTYVIGFCVLVRRSALDEVGGIDTTLPGGDDLDLSIRMRKAGYRLVAKNDVFIYHHGFKTGERVHGGPDQPGGWNSAQMSEATNIALIRKHGLRAWWECIRGVVSDVEQSADDPEAAVVKRYLRGGAIAEVGCGGKKTVPEATGFDKVPRGQLTEQGAVSVADVVADVFDRLPVNGTKFDTLIARHILEHAIDPLDVLRKWKDSVRLEGRLIVACPDERFTRGVPMDPTHLHAFTPDSLQSIARHVGLRAVAHEDGGNGVSFVSVYERIA